MGLFRPSDLFGNTSTIITANGREVNSRDLFFMKEQRGILSAVGEVEWEKVRLTVDSGASDTVVPSSVPVGKTGHHRREIWD